MDNIYEQFRKYVSTLTYPSNILVELHHEPPHHTGKSFDDSELNVIASLEHHALLHFYRYLVYGQHQDKVAWLWRKGQTEDARRLMAQKVIETHKRNRTGFWAPDHREKCSIFGKLGATASHEVQKEKKIGRWNSETQRRLALMGNTPEVLKKKSEGGKNGGKKSSETHRKRGTGVYSEEFRKKGNLLGNLSRWGIVINGTRISRTYLPEEFVEWFLIHKVNKFTICQSAAEFLTPEESVQRLLGELGVARNTRLAPGNDNIIDDIV